MIKYKRNCKACQMTKGNPKLRKRIYYATFKRQEGDETLQQIGWEVGISQQSIYNHARKHLSQYDVSTDVKAIKLAKKTEELKAAAQKELEVALDHESIEAHPAAVLALKEYISQGHQLIKQGKLNITPQSFLLAVRTDIEYESKKRGQNIEIMKTMYAFASGKKKVKDEPVTTGTPDSVDTGSEESDSIYRTIVRDAATPGAETVH